jgi:hypothetical protein
MTNAFSIFRKLNKMIFHRLSAIILVLPLPRHKMAGLVGLHYKPEVPNSQLF